MILGKFYNTNSLIHKLNPLCKLLSILIYVISVLIVDNLNLLIPFILLCILGVILSKVPYRLYLKPIFSLKIFFIFIIIINLIFKVDFIVTLKSIICLIVVIAYSNILLFTTTIKDINCALEFLLMPFKFLGINPSKISLSITYALRFIPTIFDRAKLSLKSLSSRGMDYKSLSFKNKIFAIKAMLIPILSTSLKATDYMTDSMEVRLFNFSNKKFNTRLNEWNFVDSIICLIHFILFIIIIFRGVLYEIFNYVFI